MFINKKNNYEIPSYEEEVFLQYWLQGKTRDEIAQAFEVSQGTVSNIIAKFKSKLGRLDFEAARELGRQLRRHNMTLENCAIGFRVFNIIKKLGIQEEKIQEFLPIVFELTQKMGISTEILREALLEFYKISQMITFSEIPIHLQQMREKIEEKENKKSNYKKIYKILKRKKQ